MAADFSKAIVDRDQADLERFRQLDKKKFGDMTDEEQAEWLLGSKATYNASDMNRVGEFILDLASRLKTIAGISVDVSPKTNWAYTDIPSSEQLNRYISDLHELRSALKFNTADIPSSISNLTLFGANAIEQMCLDLNAVLINLDASGFFCDELFSDEI